MGKRLVQNDFVRVRLVFGGIKKIRRDIASGDFVFCICHIARDYQIGAPSAATILNEAAEGENALLVRDREDFGSYRLVVYKPKHPATGLALRLAEEVGHIQMDVLDVYNLLKKAYPSFQRGKRLKEQDAKIRDTFVYAFENLIDIGVLPPSLGNSHFNFEGMTLLMKACFISQEKLIEYLRNPEIIRKEEANTLREHFYKLLSDDVREKGKEPSSIAPRGRGSHKPVLPDYLEESPTSGLIPLHFVPAGMGFVIAALLPAGLSGGEGFLLGLAVGIVLVVVYAGLSNRRIVSPMMKK